MTMIGAWHATGIGMFSVIENQAADGSAAGSMAA
jgi:hypothetical protein